MTPRIGEQIIPAHHKETHQDGGADEVSIAALSGTPAALTTHAAVEDAHHTKYTDVLALAAAIAGGLSKVVWKDADEIVLADLDRTAGLAFTDLDLTAYTSANAKFAILTLRIHVDSISAGAANGASLSIRKNGTAPGLAIYIQEDGAGSAAGSYVWQQIIMGLDSGQVVEYQFAVNGTIQFDTHIYVSGYIE